MSLVIYPLIIISGVGFVASAWLHAGLRLGLAPASGAALALTTVCIVVWIPAIVIAWKMTRDPSMKDLWHAALAGRPRWARAVITALTWYAIANTLLQMIPAARILLHSTILDGWPVALHILSGCWMAFYAAAIGVCCAAVSMPN